VSWASACTAAGAQSFSRPSLTSVLARSKRRLVAAASNFRMPTFSPCASLLGTFLSIRTRRSFANTTFMCSSSPPERES
jgi:hypothetical protein